MTQQVFAQFGSQNIIDKSNAINPTGLITADLNNDGFKDIIASQGFGGQVSYYLNQGDNTFGSGQVLTSVVFPWSSASGDFDNDG